MFTGIVQSLGTLEAVMPTAAGKRFVVALGGMAGAPMSHGDSVCVSGVCLTLVRVTGGKAEFDVITETLHRSTLGRKKAGDRLNLELSLRGDSYLGGHFVQGHVDAVGSVAAVAQDPRDWRLTFRAGAAVMPCIVPKGSVSVDGVSMTIAEVGRDTFTLAVIPTTLEKTTLGALRAGDEVNVETDILARTVVHYLQQLSHARALPDQPAITLARLRELGMA